MSASIDTDIRRLADTGLTQTEIAERVGVSQSRVSRVLSAGSSSRRAPRAGAALRAVDGVARSLGDVSPDVLARLEAARVLARKLDWSTGANTGSAALAAASLTKELRSLLDELKASSSFDELREALLAGADD